MLDLTKKAFRTNCIWHTVTYTDHVISVKRTTFSYLLTKTIYEYSADMVTEKM